MKKLFLITMMFFSIFTESSAHPTVQRIYQVYIQGKQYFYYIRQTLSSTGQVVHKRVYVPKPLPKAPIIMQTISLNNVTLANSGLIVVNGQVETLNCTLNTTSWTTVFGLGEESRTLDIPNIEISINTYKKDRGMPATHICKPKYIQNSVTSAIGALVYDNQSRLSGYLKISYEDLFNMGVPFNKRDRFGLKTYIVPFYNLQINAKNGTFYLSNKLVYQVIRNNRSMMLVPMLNDASDVTGKTIGPMVKKVMQTKEYKVKFWEFLKLF